MKTAVRRVLLMSALLGPGAAFALGLGEIKLNSALNQPFDAEIELVSATSDDLGALRAALASNDTFVRYGLDRPAYLIDFNFRVAKGSGGRDILRVTSPRPVTEPFVTLLVEASWPRGRLLREYTVLLDPPVYAPGPAAAAPVAAAPRVSSGGATTARAAAPVAAESNESARAPRAPAAAIEPGSEYRVRPNDTLWEIARSASPGSRSDVNRAMVSIYQTNPHAFDGNINVLRSGSSLRIPDANQIRSISAKEASAEVARQYDAWRSGERAPATTGTAAAAPAAEAGRLRLVPPQQGTAAPSTTTTSATAPRTGTAPAATSGDVEARVQQLETELAEARRLLEVRNAELATLQGGATVPADGTAVPAPTDATTPADAAGAAATPPAAADAAAAPKVDKPKKPKKQRPVEPPAPSLLERITDYWWVLLGLVGLGLGALLFQRVRRERGNAEDSLEAALGTREPRSNMRFSPRPRDEDIVVEEKRGHDVGRAVPAAAAMAEPARKVTSVADTLSGDGPASLESGDPLAEADFHMAYGLYDQAADLVQLAMKREPQRRDLKLKLLEIFFVWGNKDKFLDLARDLHASRSDAPAGEWDKVLIMGKQIAPGDALFTGTLTAASTDSLDMELHGSPNMLDLEIPSGDSGLPDMDLTESSAATEIAPIDRSGIDFILDEPVRGADESSVLPTIEMPQIRKGEGSGGDTQELTVDRLGLDMGALRGLDSLESLDANEAIDARKRATSDTIETTSIMGAQSLLDDDSEDLLGSTALMRMADDTSLLPRDESLEGLVDLSDVTGEMPSLDSTSVMKGLSSAVDYDLGGEPATMSEVGTKLDLARAYMDMGDPEGARSILDEVLQEGNPTQRQEAERLISSLP